MKVIDCDNLSTFPSFIADIVISHTSELQSLYSTKHFEEEWRYWNYIELSGEQYSVLRPLIDECLPHFETLNITGYHSTRVLSIDSIKNYGLEKANTDKSRTRLCRTFTSLGFTSEEIDYIIERCEFYWKRDSNRRDTVHFYSCKNCEEEYQSFSDNIGGEVVSFALGQELKTEPYNKLCSCGIPIAVKFHYSFRDLDPVCKDRVALSIIKVEILKYIKNISIVPEFDGWVNTSIPASDILKVIQIKN